MLISLLHNKPNLKQTESKSIRYNKQLLIKHNKNIIQKKLIQIDNKLNVTNTAFIRYNNQ